MKTILASLSAVVLSIGLSACQTAPKHGTCPVTGASTTCSAEVKSADKKACCSAKNKTAKSKKAAGASCCS